MRPQKLRLIAGFARLDELEGKTEARTAAVSDAPDPALRGVPGVDAEHPSVAVDHAIEVADNNTDVKSHQLRRFAHCLLLWTMNMLIGRKCKVRVSNEVECLAPASGQT